MIKFFTRNEDTEELEDQDENLGDGNKTKGGKGKDKEKLETRKKPYRGKAKDKKGKNVEAVDQSKQDDEEQKQGDKESTKQKQKVKEEGPQFYAAEKYAIWYADTTKIKFLVDNMAFKLAKYMRNLGLDAEYQDTKDHQALTELAKSEQRVILTRDSTYYARHTGVPCLLLSCQITDDQLKEVIEYFHMKVSKDTFLSRCVKCNHTGLVVMELEEAKKQMQWKNDADYANYDTFWQCERCKQVYWEGETFKKARVRFKEFASSEENPHNINTVLESQAVSENPVGLDTEIQNFEFMD